MTDEIAADFDGDFDSVEDVGAEAGEFEDGNFDSPEDDFEGPADAIPTELTSDVFSTFAKNFGPEQAALLQSSWGDAAVGNQWRVEAMVADHSELSAAIGNNRTEDGITAEGTQLAAQYLAEKSGFGDHENPIEALGAAHPVLSDILTDHFDESTGLSMVGVFKALDYVGRNSGYSYKYRAPR